MEKRKKTTKVKKTVKRRVKQKVSVSSLKERRFVVPISIRIPISHETFAAVQTTRKEFSIAKAGLILMLIVGPSLFFGLLSIENTIAFYNDFESSIGNIFSAASLDFTVDIEKKDNDDCKDNDEDDNGYHKNNSGDDEGHHDQDDDDDGEDCNDHHNGDHNGDNGDDNGGLSPGGSITQFATIQNGGTLDFQYMVEVEKTGGNDAFCNALDLEAVLEGAPYYTGDLMTFVSSPVVYSTSTDEWKFVISLPSDTYIHGSCSFDFVFSGWQTTFPNFGGFSDIERVDDPVYSVASVTVASEENNREAGSGIESDQDAFPSFSETLGSVTSTTTEFILGAEEAAMPTSTETIVDDPVLTPEITVSSSSVSSELSPEPSPVVTPESAVENPQPPASDDSSVQTPIEPAIPTEPIIIEPPVEPAPPSTDPPAPTPTDSINSPQAE